MKEWSQVTGEGNIIFKDPEMGKNEVFGKRQRQHGRRTGHVYFLNKFEMSQDYIYKNITFHQF